MNARELVAWNVRRLRVERGIAQEALAGDAEIDRTYVSRMERGMENPTVGVLERIARALGVPITDFFTVPKTGAKLAPLLPGGRKAAMKRSSPKG
ncbi:MAG: helix-turn-helix transcriptional regulator [Burkholderiales bacterium]|nr:helix-turn-helix transcriptional regulator [Burkholderiales bacterium]